MSLRIGELAERTGRSVHALRYYERCGLVPNVERDRAGRRRYSERHVGWMALLGRLRSTGMSVERIRRYVALIERGDETLRERQAFLGRHRERVLEQIAELEQCVELIDGKIDLYQRWIDRGGSSIELPGED